MVRARLDAPFLEGSDACSRVHTVDAQSEAVGADFPKFFLALRRVAATRHDFSLASLRALMKGAGLTYRIHAIELTDLLAQFSMDQRRAHLDPAYRSALLTCAVLNIAMAFIEGIVGLWITG
jgi:hypothetical protein